MDGPDPTDPRFGPVPIPQAVPAMPSRAARSEATTIEQSRAVAQVQAQFVVAQQRPRDIDAAMGRIRQMCAIPAFAERAFYAYKRGGETISDVSINFARGIAGEWGNLDYGIAELARDDGAGSSEMKAFCMNLESNVTSSNSFIAAHMRDTKSGKKNLRDERDIYENNANLAARRLRQCILACIPTHVIDEAKDIARRTMASFGGKKIGDVVAAICESFGVLGVTVDQLSQRIGRPRTAWMADDVAELRILYGSLRSGDMTIDEEFPPIVIEQSMGASGGGKGPLAGTMATVTVGGTAEKPAASIVLPGQVSSVMGAGGGTPPQGTPRQTRRAPAGQAPASEGQQEPPRTRRAQATTQRAPADDSREDDATPGFSAPADGAIGPSGADIPAPAQIEHQGRILAPGNTPVEPAAPPTRAERQPLQPADAPPPEKPAAPPPAPKAAAPEPRRPAAAGMPPPSSNTVSMISAEGEIWQMTLPQDSGTLIGSFEQEIAACVDANDLPALERLESMNAEVMKTLANGYKRTLSTVKGFFETAFQRLRPSDDAGGEENVP